MPGDWAILTGAKIKINVVKTGLNFRFTSELNPMLQEQDVSDLSIKKQC
jgi:hypothetical protein